MVDVRYHAKTLGWGLRVLTKEAACLFHRLMGGGLARSNPTEGVSRLAEVH